MKVRPAIIVGKYIDNSAIIVHCTSRPPRNKFDFVLEGWEEYGLIVPTTARVSKIDYAPIRAFHRYMGKCHPSDWEKIKTLLDKLF